MPCKSFIAVFVFLFCFAPVPALAHPLDGSWHGFRADYEMVVDVEAGRITSHGEEFTIKKVAGGERWLGEAWLIGFGEPKTGKSHELVFRLLDGVLLEVAEEGDDYKSYLLKEGFSPPTQSPAGVWMLDGGAWADLYDLDNMRMFSYRQLEQEEPYEESGSEKLVPVEVFGSALIFRIGDDDYPEFYRAAIPITDKFLLFTAVTETDTGLCPDAENGVLLLYKNE